MTWIWWRGREKRGTLGRGRGNGKQPARTEALKNSCHEKSKKGRIRTSQQDINKRAGRGEVTTHEQVAPTVPQIEVALNYPVLKRSSSFVEGCRLFCIPFFSEMPLVKPMWGTTTHWVLVQFDLILPSVQGQTEDNVLCKDPPETNSGLHCCQYIGRRVTPKGVCTVGFGLAVNFYELGLIFFTPSCISTFEI